jgi:hypothetical protein
VLKAQGSLEWKSCENGSCVVFDREPNAGWIRRVIVKVLEKLPIESQL